MPEYRLSLDFTAADDAQAQRLAEAWAGTCAAEYGTRYGGVERLPDTCAHPSSPCCLHGTGTGARDCDHCGTALIRCLTAGLHAGDGDPGICCAECNHPDGRNCGVCASPLTADDDHNVCETCFRRAHDPDQASKGSYERVDQDPPG